MKPEEILYNTVLEIDPNYGISLEEFTANLYQNEGYLLELDESVRGFDDQTNKALDQVKINFKPEVVQSSLDESEKPKEITINEKLNQLLPLGLFEAEGLNNEEKARTLTRYLNKVSPSLNAKYDNQFGTGGYATIDINGNKINLATEKPIESQKKLVNTLINLQENLNLEELEANIAKDDAEFKSLTSYDKPDPVKFNIGEYKYKGNTILPFVLDNKTQKEIDNKLGTQYRFNVVTGKEEPYNDLSIFDKVEVEKYVRIWFNRCSW